MVSASTSLHSTRRLLALLHLVLQYALHFFLPSRVHLHHPRSEHRPHDAKFIAFACLVPVLVLLSGVFAGLTLGYMSLDVTQLNVLSVSGTPQQRILANKIIPVRKNGHLLLVTLLLSNMIVNETLPVIMHSVLGGGVPTVVLSTVLIVIFAEVIPQSIFTRHGLYLGAKLAGITQCLIYSLGIIAWPVAKFLELTLGPHHGIIYRRAELKELIALHSRTSAHGGDLKHDTVTIIGATLDLQEKVVSQAMTPIQDVFMLSIDAKLDYELLKKICKTGHSRVPVFEEIELPPGPAGVLGVTNLPRKVNKIVGILLVKQCVLLDPKDAIPLRKIPLNRVLFVPKNESLLGILDKFQEGGSHMAIVSRFSVEKAVSIKKAVKQGLTQRLRQTVRMGETDSSSSDEEQGTLRKRKASAEQSEARFSGEDTLKDEDEKEDGSSNTKIGHKGNKKGGSSKRRAHRRKNGGVKRDLEAGISTDTESEKAQGWSSAGNELAEVKETRRSALTYPKAAVSVSGLGLEQSMPADAVLTKEGAKAFLQSLDPAIEPLGIITLEDVLEELIGEEIYDEFDTQGARAELSSYAARTDPFTGMQAEEFTLTTTNDNKGTSSKVSALKGLSFLLPRSGPASATSQDRDSSDAVPTEVREAEQGDVAVPTVMVTTPLGDKNMSHILKPELTATNIEVSSSPSANSEETTINPSLITTAPAIAAITRGGSPVPSLEAILLDRKRRLTAANTTTPGPTSPSLSTAGPASMLPGVGVVESSTSLVPVMLRSASAKGKFKSSPIAGALAGVVAEEVPASTTTVGGIQIPEKALLPATERILDAKDVGV